MIIFAPYQPGYRSLAFAGGRKVRTAQGSTPVNSRFRRAKVRRKESATENNRPGFKSG
jgi:hypothetical protein